MSVKNKLNCIGTFLFICALLSYSGENQDRFRTGKYISRDISCLSSIPVTITSGVTHFIKGSELNINPDSTFSYITCGMQFSGTWQCDNDSVYLNVINAKYKNETYNRNFPEIKTDNLNREDLRFRIENEFLQTIRINKNGQKVITLPDLQD